MIAYPIQLTPHFPPEPAFNSNNASAVQEPVAPHSGNPTLLLPRPRSNLTRTYLRRARVFPPTLKGTPRNPKYALRVIGGVADSLAVRGAHACSPQIHNVWDRASCQRCLSLPQLLAAGLTPEVDPCAGYYAALKSQVIDGVTANGGAPQSDEAAAQQVASNTGDEPHCARNICAGGSGGAVGEDVLKVHHYILPVGAKKYRRAGAGDAGAKRDMWDDDVLDDDALRFT